MIPVFFFLDESRLAAEAQSGSSGGCDDDDGPAEETLSV